nr:immunoglobulin heavy chain junction region [Macaca mulatta]MOW98924.1 immunoglobulin heavy chain junction region [Macaca mulatta]MOW99103.1 immunoglobulin heavy chain junction region [Macaca mulatta]MOW99975.1 immunoglobulin heavy chain junction region [Macaca mulatta]MOW99992.1 immunoglobulin heavy chain junction region [Macaca mulatta]
CARDIPLYSWKSNNLDSW